MATTLPSALAKVEDKSVLDAALIAAGQTVEHYEITRHGSLIVWAKELGRKLRMLGGQQRVELAQDAVGAVE
jgi:ferritin-like metal-binding protein YciE